MSDLPPFPRLRIEARSGVKEPILGRDFRVTFDGVEMFWLQRLELVFEPMDTVRATLVMGPVDLEVDAAVLPLLEAFVERRKP